MCVFPSNLPRFRLAATALAAAGLLAGCLGDSTSADGPVASQTPPQPLAATLSGTVAVGAPITDGKLRVLDALGAVVVEDVAIDAEGRYAGLVLPARRPTGSRPAATPGRTTAASTRWRPPRARPTSRR